MRKVSSMVGMEDRGSAAHQDSIRNQPLQVRSRLQQGDELRISILCYCLRRLVNHKA